MADPGHYRSMKYDAWPDLSAHCPCCGGKRCAVYRGYYVRYLFCPEMEFVGRLAVRTGFCSRRHRRFALLPDFLFHRRRISRLSRESLRDAFVRHAHLPRAIDELIAGLGDEFYLPRSTAHSYLHPSFAVPP